MSLWRCIAAIVCIAMVAWSWLERARVPDSLLGTEAGPLFVSARYCPDAQTAESADSCVEPPASTSPDAGDRAAAHVKRALFFIELGKFDRSRGELDAALKLSPDMIQALHLSARLAVTPGVMDLDRAEKDIAVALRRVPQHPDLRTTNVFILKARLGDEEAWPELNDIIRRHPKHVVARALRGQILLTSGRPKDALDDLRFAVDAGQVQHRFKLAEAYVASGQPAEAAAVYTAGLKEKPNDYALLVGRATALGLSGDDTAALLDLDFILGPAAGRPNYAVAGNELAKLLMQRALILVREKRFEYAAADMAAAVASGGTPAILRAQLFLRQNGFPEVALDGQVSDSFRAGLDACFRLNSCFESIMHRI